MDYIEDDFTDALIDAVCGKLPSTWYTLIGENFDPDEESRKLTIRRTLKMHLMKAKTTLIRYM
mgnify:CR=1 FL=1